MYLHRRGKGHSKIRLGEIEKPPAKAQKNVSATLFIERSPRSRSSFFFAFSCCSAAISSILTILRLQKVCTSTINTIMSNLHLKKKILSGNICPWFDFTRKEGVANRKGKQEAVRRNRQPAFPEIRAQQLFFLMQHAITPVFTFQAAGLPQTAPRPRERRETVNFPSVHIQHITR